MNTSPTFVHTGFAALTLIYLSIFIYMLQKGIVRSTLPEAQKKKLSTRIVIVVVLWVVFVSAWSLSGMMGDFSKFPFNVGPVLIIPLIASILITFSGSFTAVIQQIPVAHLLYLQSFRIFVELLIWGLFVGGEAPVQMTFEGQNLDILTGLTALIVGYLATRQKISRTVLILWNIAGLALLVNIVAVAILSMPTPLRIFTNEPGSAIVAQFPVSWLPGLLVPLAYTLHFFSLRQIITQKV
jgi:hypothetical protein